MDSRRGLDRRRVVLAEKMKPEDRTQAAKLIYEAVRAIQDGSISPAEAKWLCRAGAELLEKVRPKAKRWLGRTAIDTASMVLRQLASDIEDLAE